MPSKAGACATAPNLSLLCSDLRTLLCKGQTSTSRPLFHAQSCCCVFTPSTGCRCQGRLTRAQACWMKAQKQKAMLCCAYQSHSPTAAYVSSTRCAPCFDSSALLGDHPLCTLTSSALRRMRYRSRCCVPLRTFDLLQLSMVGTPFTSARRPARLLVVSQEDFASAQAAHGLRGADGFVA